MDYRIEYLRAARQDDRRCCKSVFLFLFILAEDFELIFGEKKSVVNHVKHLLSNKWFNQIVICAWIFTPGIADNQTMTVISVITDNNNEKRVLTVQISGLGGFHIIFGAQR